MTEYELATIIIGIISTLLILAGLLYTAIQIKKQSEQIELLRKQHTDNHDWNRRIQAQLICNEYKTHVNEIKILNENLNFQSSNDPIPLDFLKQKFNEINGLRDQCHNLLNYFEGLCIGILQGIYDEEVIKKNWEETIIHCSERFRQYILHRREIFEVDVWRDLETIANQWKNEKTNKNRRPHIE